MDKVKIIRGLIAELLFKVEEILEIPDNTKVCLEVFKVEDGTIEFLDIMPVKPSNCEITLNGNGSGTLEGNESWVSLTDLNVNASGNKTYHFGDIDAPPYTIGVRVKANEYSAAGPVTWYTGTVTKRQPVPLATPTGFSSSRSSNSVTLTIGQSIDSATGLEDVDSGNIEIRVKREGESEYKLFRTLSKGTTTLTATFDYDESLSFQQRVLPTSTALYKLPSDWATTNITTEAAPLPEVWFKVTQSYNSVSKSLDVVRTIYFKDTTGTIQSLVVDIKQPRVSDGVEVSLSKTVPVAGLTETVSYPENNIRSLQELKFSIVSTARYILVTDPAKPNVHIIKVGDYIKEAPLVVEYPYYELADNIGSNTEQLYNKVEDNHKTNGWGGTHLAANYGAVGNGVVDDTAALKAMMEANRLNVDTGDSNDYFSPRPKSSFLRKGVYLISDSLPFIGMTQSVEGQGIDHTIIRLKDNCPGFQDKNNPKAVIQTGNGIQQFRNYFRNITIHTGSGNPGAIGVDFIANNSGGFYNVKVISGDGQGVEAIRMSRFAPGPFMLNNVILDGFDKAGVISKQEYSLVFKDVTLHNQKICGFENETNVLTIQGLKSELSVPAIISNTYSSSMVLIVDSELKGTNSSISAIDATHGSVFIRNVKAPGYKSVLKLKGTTVPGTSIVEYTDQTPQVLSGNKATSLNLDIPQVPDYINNDTTQWAEFHAQGWYGDVRSWQPAFNSGKPIAYILTGTYYAHNKEFTIPVTLRKIQFYGAYIARAPNGGFGMKLHINEGDENSPPLILENMGDGVWIEHNCKRTIVVRNSKLNNYVSSVNAGTLFMEQVELHRAIVIQPNQKVYAWQWNNESNLDRITNNGGQLVCLGFKTENKGYICKTSNGGKSEILGGLLYPARAGSVFTEEDPAAFINVESDMSVTISTQQYKTGMMYLTLVEETRNGVTRTVPKSALVNRTLQLYAGHSTTVTPPVTTNTYRINCGDEGSVTNSFGAFSADSFFSPGGRGTTSKGTIVGAGANDNIYRSSRVSELTNGEFSYTFPVKNNDYLVVLHFAEVYWTDINKRVFDVLINGVRVLDQFDIVKESGGPYTAISKAFPVEVTTGEVTITFTAATNIGGINNPIVAAIEVLESSGSAGTISSSNSTDTSEKLTWN